MRKLYIIAFMLMATCLGCQWHLRPDDQAGKKGKIAIDRYDRMEQLYLTTADFAALQQMKTVYPMQTRMLIEDVLKLGRVDESDINTRLLLFFQDSTLQALIKEVALQYDDIHDLDEQLNRAFAQLVKMLPTLKLPSVYTQIGSLDQSIIAGNGMLGISLDKYLGSDHPLYLRYGYTEEQRRMMTRQYIVPDCIGFYLMSLYPLPEDDADDHVAKIQYVVNEAMGQRVFTREKVMQVESYMQRHPEMTIEKLLNEPIVTG